MQIKQKENIRNFRLLFYHGYCIKENVQMTLIKYFKDVGKQGVTNCDRRDIFVDRENTFLPENKNL